MPTDDSYGSGRPRFRGMLRSSHLCIAAALFLAPFAWPQGNPSGHWEGAISVGPQQVGLSLDLAKNAKAEWEASMGAPAEDKTGVVVQRITVNGARVSFVVPDMMSKVDLTLTAGGTMKGTITTEQGLPISVELKRTGEAKVELKPAGPAVSKDLEGGWESTQRGPGGLAPYPMIFHFKNQPDKTVSATMDMFARYVMAMPLSDVKQTGRKVEFGIRATHAAFTGTLNREGTELSGQFSQEGEVVQLTLHKRTDEAIAEIAANPFVGTWKLNVEKSNFSSAALKSATMTVHGIGNGTVFVQEMVDSQGMDQMLRAMGRWDGKEGKSDFPGLTSLSSRVDNNTVVAVFKADGKETMRVTEALSNGGKSWTRTVRGKDEQGNGFENILVFEKQ